MDKFGKFVVKNRIVILIVSLLLIVPSLIGMIKTRVNYDMLDYLPETMDTVKGQNILLDDFGKGAFSILVVDGMQPKEVSQLKKEIEKIDHVDSVIWYDSFADISVPMEMLPKKYYEAFNKNGSTLMAVFFDTSTSSDDTMKAIGDVKKVCGKNTYVTGMSALVTELKELCEAEEATYVGIAVVLAVVAMLIFMDSFLVPFVFIASIGIAILWNMGTNYFFGEVSYITKALAAVLQLAVTMDYSIFLWNCYSEQKNRFEGDKNRAMAHAISNTITSVVGSSITTIAGFLALCFMTFTLGKDLGLVMAKGVVLGVIGCVTTLPVMILVFDKAIEKTKHKVFLPKMDKLANGIVKGRFVILAAFVVILIPAFFGYRHTPVYYDLGQCLPEKLDFVQATKKLNNDYNMANTHMVLIDSSLNQKEVKKMMKELEKVDGVKMSLGMSSALGSLIPDSIIPEKLVKTLKSDRYELVLVTSEYYTATDEVNNQIDELNEIIKKYDPNGMIIGEAACTKDMIAITDHDFNVVTWLSIAAIFLIIAFVFKSASLPFILVSVIEFAIFVNLGLPYFTNTELPFIGPICVSTIQLGATVDYAILMTTRYLKERRSGKEKKDSVTVALSSSLPSIIVSAVGFFAATFGVGIYSNVDIISTMCNLMARGAAVSMLSVVLVLPTFLMLFDGLIIHTTSMKKKEN
ncbi:MAG: MMPL family transporter [Treponema sp.]|nr:MMPL family transporter [Treponema sp.]